MKTIPVKYIDADEKEQTVEVTLKRIIVSNMAEAHAVVAPFLESFNNKVRDGKALNGSELFTLSGLHRDDMVNMCLLLTDIDKAILDVLEPDEFLSLITEIVYYCGDFFLKKWIEPLIILGKKLNALSLTLYSLSSKTGTDGQKS